MKEKGLLSRWIVIGVGLSALMYSTISVKFYNDRETCIEKIVNEADVNHDGYEDLRVLNGNGKIKIFYGNSEGEYYAFDNGKSRRKQK